MLWGYSAMPAIFAGSIVVLYFEIRTPKKSIWGCIKIDLDSFRCRPCSASRSNKKLMILMWKSRSLSVVPSPKSSI